MNKPTLSNRITKPILVFFLITFIACVSISRFDQYSYAQTTSIKVDALELMDLAVNDYSSYEANDRDFQTKLKKIYEYEKVCFSRIRRSFSISFESHDRWPRKSYSHLLPNPLVQGHQPLSKLSGHNCIDQNGKLKHKL